MSLKNHCDICDAVCEDGGERHVIVLGGGYLEFKRHFENMHCKNHADYLRQHIYPKLVEINNEIIAFYAQNNPAAYQSWRVEQVEKEAKEG